MYIDPTSMNKVISIRLAMQNHCQANLRNDFRIFKIILKYSFLKIMNQKLSKIIRGYNMNENVIINKLNDIEKKLNNNKVNRWVTLSQLQKITGLSASTIYRSISRGILRGQKSSPKGKWLFSQENISRWLNG